MIRIEDFEGIFLHCEYVDMRKSINGLSILVQNEMNMDPFSKYLFVFCNRKRTLLKILYWDKTGFALWHKRLEEEKFPWPKHMPQDVVEIDQRKLELFLEGYEFWKLKPHKTLNYETVC